MTDPAASQQPCPALITTWRNLQDTTGESIETTWAQWFATLQDPGRYRGDLQHAGWSACASEPPVRAAANVCGMSALVLDYDNGTDISDAAELWADHFGFIHTSRSHKPDAHRFRVILPFSRVVTPDQYPIVWRWAQKIATSAGQRIDPATKDLARFWYMPAATDHYETIALRGEPIDPDPILAAHEHDERERQQPRAHAHDGNIEKRASRYLARLPESLSGSGGHQALWAAALALVRGFRMSSDRALAMLRTEFNPRCKPPWTDRELKHKVDDAEKDATTPYGYLADKVRAVPEPPQDPDWQPPEPPPDVDDQEHGNAPPRVTAPGDWRAQLSQTPQGHIRNTFDNLCRILEHHESYGPLLAFDEMRLTPMVSGRAVTDADVGRIRREVEQHFGFQPSDANVRAALGTVSADRRYHPVRRYLESLEWDGEERICRVVPDVLGAVNTALHQTMLRKWFISAVARAMRPGCKVDTALVLVGRQAAMKSTFFATLGGEWFSDTYMDITDKDGIMQLHSAWIYEWAEIESVTTRKQASEIKQFVTSQTDTFRQPFGRTVGVHHRSTVIVGTTNEERFLSDPTGSRRFWVVRVGHRIAIDIIRQWRDQLWAEALAAFRDGEIWWLDDESDAQRESAADEYVVDDSWEQPIAEWLVGRQSATTADILSQALGMLASQQNQQTWNRLGAVMRRLGWIASRKRESGRQCRVWTRAGVTPTSHPVTAGVT
jgi:predicted P-loop ATPase